MINDHSYFVVHGWMIKELELKGVDRDVYAIIYGFSQDTDSNFHGSLSYLAEMTGYSKQAVIYALKTLVTKNLIIKEEYGFNKIRYRVNFETSKISSENGKNILPSASKKTLTNNKNIDNIDNKESSVAMLEKQKYTRTNKQPTAETSQIIEFFNKTCGTNFKANSIGTLKLIKQRLKEGYTLQDFYDVITDRYDKWVVHKSTFSSGQTSDVYMRPSTLFSPKMENYLIEAKKAIKKPVVQSIKKLDDRATKTF